MWNWNFYTSSRIREKIKRVEFLETFFHLDEFSNLLLTLGR